MSSTHLPGNKLVSTEKPGWVAATAEGRGSVKAVSTRGKVAGGQAKALILPLQPLRQGRREPHILGCQLPASLPHIHCLSRKPLPARELVCPVGRELFPGSSGPQRLNNGPESHSKSVAKAAV